LVCLLGPFLDSHKSLEEKELAVAKSAESLDDTFQALVARFFRRVPGTSLYYYCGDEELAGDTATEGEQEGEGGKEPKEPKEPKVPKVANGVVSSPTAGAGAAPYPSPHEGAKEKAKQKLLPPPLKDRPSLSPPPLFDVSKSLAYPFFIRFECSSIDRSAAAQQAPHTPAQQQLHQRQRPARMQQVKIPITDSTGQGLSAALLAAGGTHDLAEDASIGDGSGGDASTAEGGSTDKQATSSLVTAVTSTLRADRRHRQERRRQVSRCSSV
jgi:hypothetical protein